MRYIGIDISKATLHIAFLQAKHWQESVIANEPGAIRTWMQALAGQAVQIICEATGSYGTKLLYLLHQQAIPFTVLNPTQSQGFARVQNNQSQTDARDAVLLAQYGASIRPAPSVVAPAQWEALRQLRRALRQLKKYERMVSNQLHALEQFPFQEPSVQTALEQLRSTIRTQISALETKICTCTDEKAQAMVRKLVTIHGIGPITARELVIATNGFEQFENAKQVAKFIGLSPSIKSSGTSVRKRGKITRSGDAGLRGVLYMAAISASRCNHACKDLYQRLKNKGKSTRQALVAVAHKLLRQAFGVAKSAKAFENDYYLKLKPRNI